MNQRYSGKTAVITGGASGIGAATARRMASEGANVVVLDVNLEAAQGIAAEIRGRAMRVDVSDEASVAEAFRSIDRVDVLVNSAGVAQVGDLLATTAKDFDRVYATNVRGVFLTMQAAIPRMLERGGGAIVNLASIASKIGLADRFAYSMSKGAVLAMTRSIAVDYVKRNIRCNCICPARIHTPFVDGFLAKHYPGREREMFEKLSAYQPLGRMGRPDEVALLALYLCSDASAFVTGQAFPLDGGVLMQ